MALLLDLLLLVVSIRVCNATINYQTDNISFWYSDPASVFKPIRGETYGNLKLKQNFYGEFKLIFHSQVSNDWENIFRIGKNGTKSGCAEHGSRYPAFFITPKKDAIQISLSEKSNCFTKVEANYPIQTHVMYHFQMQYNETVAIVNVTTRNISDNYAILKQNEVITHTLRTGTDDEYIGTLMDVIISDPKNNASNVTLFDLLFIFYDNNETLTFPANRSTTPLSTLSPTTTDDGGDLKLAGNGSYSTTNIAYLTVPFVVFMNYTAIDGVNKSIKMIENTIESFVIEIIEDDYIGNLNDTQVDFIGTFDVFVAVDDDDDNGHYIVINGTVTTANNATAQYLSQLFETNLKSDLLDEVCEYMDDLLETDYCAYMGIITTSSLSSTAIGTTTIIESSNIETTTKNDDKAIHSTTSKIVPIRDAKNKNKKDDLNMLFISIKYSLIPVYLIVFLIAIALICHCIGVCISCLILGTHVSHRNDHKNARVNTHVKGQGSGSNESNLSLENNVDSDGMHIAGIETSTDEDMDIVNGRLEHLNRNNMTTPIGDDDIFTSGFSPKSHAIHMSILSARSNSNMNYQRARVAELMNELSDGDNSCMYDNNDQQHVLMNGIRTTRATTTTSEGPRIVTIPIDTCDDV